MQYTPAQEVQTLHELFNKPIPIIAACNRVQAEFEAETARRIEEKAASHMRQLDWMRIQQGRERWQAGRSKRNAWFRGVFWGLGSVAVVFGLVMAIGWLAE